ncbi:uncharacterized protein HKW66_Vig0112650 [Vigna angularis]|uniref:Uncharacterized protein n=1 Tax=Phaseolus angularis TaxID=3914 RepID=A0A8T0L1Q0_PHAAN|nr:uncharacterized protein HKW66_Vig0112650 [Vigna angularis]
MLFHFSMKIGRQSTQTPAPYGSNVKRMRLRRIIRYGTIPQSSSANHTREKKEHLYTCKTLTDLDQKRGELLNNNSLMGSGNHTHGSHGFLEAAHGIPLFTQLHKWRVLLLLFGLKKTGRSWAHETEKKATITHGVRDDKISKGRSLTFLFWTVKENTDTVLITIIKGSFGKKKKSRQ